MFYGRVSGLAFAIAALACAGAASNPVFAQSAEPLSPEDIFLLEAAAEPRIAPDGSTIAYIRRSNDIMTDQTRSSIWLVDTDGSNHRPLVAGDAQTQSPQWSPDGSRLAFVQSVENGASIRIHDASGDRELTTVQGGVSNLSWSPDGRRLAFASFVPEGGLDPAPLPEQPEGAEWAASATVEDRLMFRFDGTGALPRGSQQIFILDPETGNTRQLTDGSPGASGDFTWSADGSAILFSADRRPDAGSLAPDTELHRITLRDGDISQLTNRRGPDSSPRSAPDGSRLAWLGYDDHRMGYHNVELYVGAPDGSDPQSLTAGLDRSVSAPVWADDGSGLYVQYDDHGQTRVAFVSLGGEVTIRADGLIGATFGRPYTGGSYSVADDGTVAAMTGSPVRPSDITVFPQGEEARQVTALNEDVLAHRSLSMAEDIRWTSPHDGTEIQGWVLYPPGFDPSEEWPLILEIHGGPFSAYGPSFTAELQLMAAAGYVVLYTNPRGSTSYGYDFANLIHHDYPGNDYDDLMGAIDTMLDRGFIDEERLFVTG